MSYIRDTKSKTIIQTFNNSLDVILPGDEKYHKVLVLITDAAPNMKSAGNTLCEMYDKMTHITCLSHALHNVCEYLINKYQKVNQLINYGKKVFKKSPHRIGIFKSHYPDIPLPPKPVITRWGTWLQAVEYYVTYSEEFADVVNKLDSNDSVFIESLRNLLKDNTVKNDLIAINSNYNSISKAIITLQSSKLTINSSIETIESVIESIKKSGDKSTQLVLNKLKQVLDKNKGFKRFKDISKILNGDNSVELDIDLTPIEIACLKGCPLTNCDLERSFSDYKQILSDRRMSFCEENLNKTIVIKYNSRN
jgi:hypothetical protein